MVPQEFDLAVRLEHAARNADGEAAQVMSEAAARLRELHTYLDTPELYDFEKGIVAEAQHQRKRWGTDHDAGKTNPDWFWLVGYLAGKALKSAESGDMDKALHHIITTAAALGNWHAALTGASTAMRPGIDGEAAA